MIFKCIKKTKTEDEHGTRYTLCLQVLATPAGGPSITISVSETMYAEWTVNQERTLYDKKAVHGDQSKA